MKFMKTVQIYKMPTLPGKLLAPEAHAARPAVRVIDGKADIIPADIGYYMPAENWRRLVETPGTPVQRHHVGRHWVPVIADNSAGRFDFGIPEGVSVWAGDIQSALREAVEHV